MADYYAVSNRGPFSAYLKDGEPALRRGAGGLVTALLPLVRQGRVGWIFPISTDEEKAAHAAGAYAEQLSGLDPVEVDPDDYGGAYNGISNSILWYMNHGMFSLSRTPSFNSLFYTAWKQYRSYNQAIADHLADKLPSGAGVLLQDYHLFLVPGYLRSKRPDLRIALFLHTPFANPGEFSVLPAHVGTEILGSLAELDHMGFHCGQWLANYEATASAWSLEAASNTWVNPLGSDLGELEESASMPAVAQRSKTIAELAKGRRIIGRVDRMEPSKNILRGIESVVELFKFYPRLMRDAVHVANCYPSRQALLDYLGYAKEVEFAAREANKYLRDLAANLGIELAGDPITIISKDDFPLSIALLQESDILLINPIRDGFNLVANEGPILNRHNCPVVLSKNAGIAEVVGDAALLVNPFDVRETALALHSALEEDGPTRIKRSKQLAAVLGAKNPSAWMQEQISWLEG